MTHLSEDLLSLYSLDPETVENRPEVESHLAECTVCRRELDLYRDMDAVLRHPDTRDAADAVSSRRGLQAILAVHHQVLAEENEAKRILEPLLKSPLKFRNADLAEREECRTEGMVRVLCREANVRHEKDPRFSHRLATTAYTIAAKLADATSMGLALRECANALRYLGRFGEALQLLDQAEKLFETSPAAAPFDVAIVNYIRAVIFVETERIEDGISAGRHAAAVFRLHGEKTRELNALLVEGGGLLLSHREEHAARTFEQVITLSRETGNRRTLASGLQNAGRARCDLGEFDLAETYLIEALTLFDELGSATEKARAMWAIASVTEARGHLDEAEQRLDAARSELAQLGLTNDVALATLEWAEVRLALGRTAGVADACRKIVVVFKNEGMLRHAKHALGVLNEALLAGHATPALVRHVRAYIEQLPANPGRIFIPLQ